MLQVESDAVRPSWRLLTAHGLVLFYVWSHPGTTVRELTRELDITERQVRRVVADLVTCDLLKGEVDPDRVGRMLYSIGRTSGFDDPNLELSGFSRILRMMERDSGAVTATPAEALSPVEPV